MSRINRIWAGLAALVLHVAAVGAAQADVTYHEPMSGAHHWTWCQQAGGAGEALCGQASADIYCQERGHGAAVDFTMVIGVGALGPAGSWGLGRTCRGGECHGFGYITCKTEPVLETFAAPMIGPHRLDWCGGETAEQCGERTAALFCRERGYRAVHAFEQASNIGALGPTQALRSGAICRGADCDGFRFITCDNPVYGGRTIGVLR